MLTVESILAILLVQTFSYIIVQVVHAVRDPLRYIPGPFLARFTRFWYFIKVWHRDFRWQNVELHKRYGPIVRLAPGEYSIDDPDISKQIYGTDSRFLKSVSYDYWKNPDPHSFQDLFSIRDPRLHQNNKRVVASLYSMSNLVQMEHCVNETVELLRLRFDAYVENGQAFDLSHWMRCYAFDSIMYLSLNKRFGVLDDGNDQGLFSNMKQLARMSSPMGRFPGLWTIFVKILTTLRIPNPLDGLISFAEQQVDRFGLDFTNKDVLSDAQTEQQSMFHQAFTAHRKDPLKMTRSAILMVAIMNVVAGTDTTGTALCSSIHLLTTNQPCLQKLRDEIGDKIRSNGLNQECILPFHDLQGLKYLQAVMKESMRLHSPVGDPMSRVVPSQGLTIGGQSFPGGTVVGINPWVAHRNKDVFGADADVFKPERWLVDDAERLAKMESYLLSFGHGSRSCTGKNISMIEMCKLLAQLVMRYDFEFLDGKVMLDRNGRDIDSDGGWFVVQTNLQVRVRSRL